MEHAGSLDGTEKELLSAFSIRENAANWASPAGPYAEGPGHDGRSNAGPWSDR